MPDHLRLCQRPDDLGATARTLPCLIWQGRHALLGIRAVLVAMLTSLWCTRVLSIDEFRAEES
jgi:hypothetical protein